ncbi:MAG: pyridoxal phosphate-dependent aminotransferase [Gammaproteobacteria bacterium]
MMSEQAMRGGVGGVDLSIFLSEERQHAPSVRQVAGEAGWAAVTDFCYLSNKFFPTPEILELLKEQLPYIIKAYPSMQSHQVKLVSQLSGVDEKRLAVGNGGSELILILGRGLGKRYLMPAPSYMEYENVFLDFGKEVLYFPLEEDREFYINVPRLIRTAKEADADGLLIVNPNTPTGQKTNLDDLLMILDALKHLEVIIVDESFIEFSNIDRANVPSVLPYLERYTNLVVVKSLGKDYGAPGLRSGFAASGNPQRVAFMRKQLPIWNISPLTECYFELLVKYRDDYERARVRCIRATQELSHDLARIDGIKVFPTYADFVLFKLTNHLTSTFLRDELLIRHGLYVRDCRGKVGLTDEFIRVGTHTEENNARLIEAIREILSHRVRR